MLSADRLVLNPNPALMPKVITSAFSSRAVTLMAFIPPPHVSKEYGRLNLLYSLMCLKSRQIEPSLFPHVSEEYGRSNLLYSPASCVWRVWQIEPSLFCEDVDLWPIRCSTHQQFTGQSNRTVLELLKGGAHNFSYTRAEPSYTGIQLYLKASVCHGGIWLWAEWPLSRVALLWRGP